MPATIIEKIKVQKAKEREFARQNPLTEGVKILLHYDAYYHASAVVLKITDKALQVRGKPDGLKQREYTAWFPRSALDLFAIPCAGGEIFYSADIRSWFCPNRYQEKLLGTLE